MGYCQKTVGCWLHGFNHSGLRGLDDLGGQGRKRRITEEGRPRIIALVKTVSPGRLRWEPVGELWAFDESGPPEWTLNSLAAVARTEGIAVGRSQDRRILPAPAWSPDGHRTKAELDYSRAPEKPRWHIFREATLTGRSFANRDDIEHATTLATTR
ncbi:helix-turn-helix domain-containing protein [Streptomyces sp. NBC_01728]|uniref:helix-turn-helix domain-containing protein n=1 Tax=unclassified Streptomyces TaxID=2593676 RepID=UPI0022555EF9|nr:MULTISPECIES: helix-turn-helix domain-containing protein [unclassified Streptomyces]MCX4461891.1 helix-turn-helix domain-containing protein [Streptomyces sp. NBC_01719]MCX4490799.1 helix-turn-helix domain-containing protein [Streptomyces sp. NBC_01728]MCX4594632.1 helix-turn-helix domain-containing protein [Streptomyces sp. NBC_01549]